MSQPASARARTRHGRASARAYAPAGPRRVSGPARRPAEHAPARPRRTTTAFDKVKALPDHRLIDTLLRSQAWVWVIGIGLGGIVAMQVSLLKYNSEISQAVESTATLERQNASLEASIARLSAGQRIEEAAITNGMVMPPAGSVEYVKARPHADARWAVKRMQPPTPEARALMANGGVVPGSLMEPPLGTATTTPTTTTTTTPTTPVTPAAAPTSATTAPAPTTPTTAPTTPAAGAAAPTTTQGQG